MGIERQPPVQRSEVRQIVRDELDSRSHIDNMSEALLSSNKFRSGLLGVTSNHFDYFKLSVLALEGKVSHLENEVNILRKGMSEFPKTCDNWITLRLAALSGVADLLNKHNAEIKRDLDDQKEEIHQKLAKQREALVDLSSKELDRTKINLNKLIIKELEANPGTALVNSIEKQINDKRSIIPALVLVFVAGIIGGATGSYIENKYRKK